ncbi:hypothetical protein WJ542_01840 [Paraburkholderia sp. B3]|uniref:hypothetical protein n=1 Tax=Paraburkholderia sp. B3 TaxID=3134791 RepID=UPI003981DDA6
MIVILNPQLVYQALERGALCFSPVPARLERTIKIPETRIFELPDVRDGSYGGVAFRQGRHRTAALAILGFTAYPVVTTDEDADVLLRKFGASLVDAIKRFDLSSISDYPVQGL